MTKTKMTSASAERITKTSHDAGFVVRAREAVKGDRK